MWAVGIGKYTDRSELEQIASDNSTVVQVTSFKTLHELWDSIDKASCKPSKL